MKLNRSALLLLFVALWGFAIEFPPVRNPNLVTIHLLPEETGKEVVLEFDKRDVNGYVGTDAIVLSVVSPSGKSVCEVALPDDGNEKNNWKLGPRQRVVLRFLAEEKGEYVVKSNSFSSVDISYAFDQAVSRNVAWGVEIKKPRFLHGRMHLFMVAAPRRIGESQDLVLQVENGKWTSMVDFQCSENGVSLMEPYTHRVKTEKRLDDLLFPLRRRSLEGILEFRAQNFAECAWRFSGYPDFILCTELNHAQVFRRHFSDRYYTGTSVECQTPQAAGGIAFAPGGTYRGTFIPDSKSTSFRFDISITGRKYSIAPGKESFVFTMPADSAYAECDWSTAPKGKILFQKITRTPEILMPESGVLRDRNTPALNWTPSVGATAYTVTMTHLDSGRQLSFPSSTNTLAWESFVGQLTPGVWRWQVTASGQTASPAQSAIFIIPEPAKTSPAFLWGQQPPMDSLQKTPPAALSIRLEGKSLADIDWKATRWVVNGTPVAARGGSDGRVEAVLPAGIFRDGRNTVHFTLADRQGILQESAWSFDVASGTERVMSHDETGRIQLNGRFFYPVIYYGYFGKKLSLESLGFNTHLTNGFSNQPQLDNMLSRNLKVLDAGCSFKDSTLEKVREYASSSVVRHPARFGMWCDEMDVHRPLEWIRDYVAIFNGRDAWRGICSCNLSLYEKMSGYGDYLMIDSYVYEHERLFHIDDVFSLARRAAGSKPLLAILCGFTNDDPKLAGFKPTPKDVEYQLYAALRHGVNGVGLYQCGPYRMEGYPEIWRQTTEMMRRFSAITFIAALDNATSSIRVTASEGKPLYRAFRKGKRLWLILQNGSFTPGHFRVEVEGASQTPVKVLFEERSIRPAGSLFSDAFTEAGTHLYLIEMK